MAYYEVPLLYAPVTTALKGAGYLLTNAAPRRLQIYEVEFGQGGTLATTDCQCQWDMTRSLTVTATGSAVASNLLDIGDTVMAASYLNNLNNEPVPTSAGSGLSLKSWSINQRGSYRWRALDDGDNLLIPAGSASGLEIRTLSSQFTSSAIGNMSFIER